MTKTKSLLVACAALALSFGAAAGPASANGMTKRYHAGMERPMMMRRHGMMMRHHDKMRHHRMMRHGMTRHHMM